MSQVGRNDPCPCGSGKKFKQCCLGRSAAPSGAFTTAEQRSALERLSRFGDREEFKASTAGAIGSFWDAWIADHSEDEVAEAFALDESGVAFTQWLFFDYRPAGGRTLVDVFLEREGDRLRTGERRYLERARLSHIRPYEVTHVRPEEGMDLRDLWTREVISVHEQLATRQLVPWDVLAVRVIVGAAGVPVLDGQPYLLPATEAEPLMKRLRREHRRFRRTFPGADLTAFFKSVAMLYHHVWLDRVALRPPPKVMTAEGDELVLARVIFDVRDRDALVTALARHPALEREDDGSYTWFEEQDDFSRRLGMLALEKGRLVLETTSKPRVERGRQLVEELAGDAVRFRATRYESIERGMERAPLEKPTSTVPPEVEAGLVAEFLDRHYRTWPDHPLPALGGLTPREAARLKSARSKLIALLKEMETMNERQRREGRPVYDFTWMWAELGLERPG